MTLVLVVLAFPLGWYVRNRLVGYVSYIAAQSFLFTFQTGKLVMEWIGGNKSAFGPYPKFSDGEVWSYAVVNLVFFAAGLGALALTYRLRSKKQAPAPAPAAARIPAAGVH